MCFLYPFGAIPLCSGHLRHTKLNVQQSNSLPLALKPADRLVADSEISQWQATNKKWATSWVTHKTKKRKHVFFVKKQVYHGIPVISSSKFRDVQFTQYRYSHAA